jgi:hypothetical protein
MLNFRLISVWICGGTRKVYSVFVPVVISFHISVSIVQNGSKEIFSIDTWYFCVIMLEIMHLTVILNHSKKVAILIFRTWRDPPDLKF